METQPTQAASTQAGSTAATAASRTDNFLSSDSFLSILAAELRYQDPLEPTSNSDYIAHMASFSGLDYQERIAEGIGSLTLSSSLSQGAALIGKSVTYSTGESIETGTVERLLVRDGAATLLVGGRQVALTDVTEVGQ
jgi:flagellar basal-body rod modification protein FlgD